ncbi:hypothetical protein [Lysinibacter sp. HNR]|uniref:hypothetical protein n=1 Tax=Lysinibacter sp. HNR TaxID=3031408 RepID=UPI0024357F97|nr:hypothetical protein [Lysinibacter sp. HNR]WGD36930.1 hypothetical protein FrondiHNR_10810 [Lysinibacter sp. HNR]
MAKRLRVSLFMILTMVGAVLIAFIVGSVIFISNLTLFSDDGSPSVQSPGPQIVAEGQKTLRVPESVPYSLSGTSLDVVISARGSYSERQVTLDVSATGTIAVTDDVLTTASLELKTLNYPALSFTLTEPCYLSRDNSVAYGTLSVAGHAQPAEITINASFTEGTGIVSGSLEVTPDLFTGIPVLKDIPPSTLSFTLDATEVTANPLGQGYPAR